MGLFGGFKEAFKKEMEKQSDQILINFYNECAKNGIHECKTEKDIQRATLIAKNQGLQFTDIKELFSKSEAALSRSKQKKKDEAFDNKKAEEKKMFDSLNRYSDKKGRDNRIAMLQSERARALLEANNLRTGANNMMRASQQKEIDWATHGGIANGIAGPAAGLAVASDIQAKNAQIRAQNDANRKALAPALKSSYDRSDQFLREAKKLEEEIEKTKIKLVADDDAATCLSKLEFSNTKVGVSSTGACIVTTTAKMKSPMTIFGDVDAVIDGTVIAKIYDGESLVGLANMVLPTHGVKAPTKLKGMCLNCGEPGKQYTVKFAAANLWAMER